MMKKYLMIIGILACAASFTGCKKSAPVAEETETDGIILETDVVIEEENEILIETEEAEIIEEDEEVVVEESESLSE